MAKQLYCINIESSIWEKVKQIFREEMGSSISYQTELFYIEMINKSNKITENGRR